MAAYAAQGLSQSFCTSWPSEQEGGLFGWQRTCAAWSTVLFTGQPRQVAVRIRACQLPQPASLDAAGVGLAHETNSPVPSGTRASETSVTASV